LATKSEKQLVVSEVKDRLERMQGAVLTDYRGLTVAQMTKLRKQLREAGVEYRVLKNTLVGRAADEVGITGLDQHLAGPTGIAFAYTDPVAPAKIITSFAKDNKQLEIKGGLLGKKVIDLNEIKALATLPSREILLAQVLAGISAPLAGLVNVFQAPLRNVAYGLEAVRKAKAEAEGQSA
jgi:large subunit ribosomal protein L10